MKLDDFKIYQNGKLKDALRLIDQNESGIIFVTDAQDRVIGVATDGDIRRKLLDGFDLQSSIEDICNKDFVSHKISTSREILIKELDTKVNVIPLVDDEGRLQDVISRNNFPITKEDTVYSQARAPVRVSFGGGGSDLTQYFDKNVGAVINTTISLYSHVTLKKRKDHKINIHSKDLEESINLVNLNEISDLDGSFGLINSLIKLIEPNFGFDLYIYSDFPMKSGLGGSATVLSAILGAFNEFKQDPWDSHEIAEIAFQAERLYLGIAGGWQDQYASVFGGFNFLEFKKDQNIVHPLRVQKDTLLQLEESLILINTGLIHESGEIHIDQKKQMKSSEVENLVNQNVELCYEMRNQLLRGKLNDFGNLLNAAWEAKRQFSKRISSPKIDEIYSEALDNGAIGGKLLGAGGGGFFIFYVPSEDRFKLIDHFKSQDITPTNFQFDKGGLRSWKVREPNTDGS